MSKSNGGEKAPAKKLNTTQMILIVGIVLILAAVIVVGAVLLTRGGATPAATAPVAAPGAGNIVVDEQNAGDMVAELNRKAEEGRYSVKMNTTWSFPDGSSPSGDAYVANSEANRRPMYFTVVLAEDEEQVLYTSPVLQVGQAVKEFALEKALDAGSYDAVCVYNLLNDDDTILSTVRISVKIEVKA